MNTCSRLHQKKGQSSITILKRVEPRIEKVVQEIENDDWALSSQANMFLKRKPQCPSRTLMWSTTINSMQNASSRPLTASALFKPSSQLQSFISGVFDASINADNMQTQIQTHEKTRMTSKHSTKAPKSKIAEFV